MFVKMCYTNIKSSRITKITSNKNPTCRIRTSDLRILCLNNYSPPLYQLS